MSKKQIQNRLNKLFDNLQPAEDYSKDSLKTQSDKPVSHPINESILKPILDGFHHQTDTTSIPSEKLTTETQTQYGSVDSLVSTLTLPFRMDTDSWGVLEIEGTPNQRILSQDDQQLVKQVVDQLALALENANLFKQTQIRSEELAILNEMGHAFTSNLDVNAIIENIYRFSSRLLDTDNFYIAQYDNETDEVTFPLAIDYGKRVSYPPRRSGKGLTEYAIKLGQPLLLDDNVSERCRELGVDVIGSESQSWLGVPMVLGEKVTGLICVHSYNQPNAFSLNSQNLLTAIAGQAVIALQNARLFDTTKTSEFRMRSLIENAPEAILVIDTSSGFISDPNTNAIQLFGINKETLVTKSLLEFCPEKQTEEISSKDLLQENINNVISGGSPVFEWVLKAQSGKLISCEVRLAHLPGSLQLVRATITDISVRKAAEKLEIALRTISDSALASQDISSLLPSIHDAVKKILPADNFYIALYDDNSNTLSFPYYVDSYDLPPQGRIPLQNTLTGYLIRSGKSQLITPEKVSELEDLGEIDRSGVTGTYGVDWLGALLKSGNRVIGAVVVQTYDEAIRLTERDKDTLSLIANQVAVAINRIQSDSELRALFSSMTDVIIVYDKDGRYLRIAPTNPSRLFLPPTELLGKTIRESLPEDTHEPFMNAIKSALNTGETCILEYSMGIDGAVYWFDASVTPLGEDQVFWVARDITDRKNFEETLRRQNEYLATSSEIGRLITSTLDLETLFSRSVNLITERFDFYHAAIFIIEETGFNAILREATGKAGEEMIRNKHFLAVGSRSVVGTVASTGKSLIVNNTAIDSTFRPNPLLPDTRAEAAIPLRIGQRTIGVIDIQSIRINSFMPDDIVVLQALADQVAVAIENARSYKLSQEAVLEMKELDRIKSQFLANMSHELRTPLNSIIGFSRVILKGIDGPITELQQQDLNAIYNSGQHLLRLINDILDLSKIDAGKMELAFDEVNIGETINSVIPTITGILKGKPIQIKQSVSPKLPLIQADPMRIRQVLINLLSNAAKFTDEGIITIEAELITSSSGQQEIMVSVSDTGPGISTEDQARLFQPFTQVDASATRKTGGTGLGLSISRSLIEMHGGRIGVHSTINEGSTFYFTLAIPKPDSEKRQRTETGQNIILAIDDDQNVINLYERYLQPQGYQVISLSDPTQVKERILQLHPLAITLDIMMPGKDGWTVLNEIKTDPETRHVPVIVCSILEAEEKGFNLGASEYLVKPILEEDLLGAINRLNRDGDFNKILVIDDDPEDLRLISKILENHTSFHPLLAEGGEQGWKTLVANPPSAVILDLFMPTLNGFEILEKLRITPNLKDIPVVVVSGVDLTSDQKKQLEDYGQNLIQKGNITEKELLSQLEKALNMLSTNSKEEN